MRLSGTHHLTLTVTDIAHVAMYLHTATAE